jgi:hypothetical protein
MIFLLLPEVILALFLFKLMASASRAPFSGASAGEKLALVNAWAFVCFYPASLMQAYSWGKIFLPWFGGLAASSGLPALVVAVAALVPPLLVFNRWLLVRPPAARLQYALFLSFYYIIIEGGLYQTMNMEISGVKATGAALPLASLAIFALLYFFLRVLFGAGAGAAQVWLSDAPPAAPPEGRPQGFLSRLRNLARKALGPWGPPP